MGNVWHMSNTLIVCVNGQILPEKNSQSRLIVHVLYRFCKAYLEIGKIVPMKKDSPISDGANDQPEALRHRLHTRACARCRQIFTDSFGQSAPIREIRG